MITRLRVQMLAADADDSVQSIANVYGGNVYGWMGTDSLGRNLWEGLLYGFPVALLIAVVVSILSTVMGASLGIISGYSGGKTDSAIQRGADVVSNVPLLPLLIFLVFIIGPNLAVIMLVLVAFSWPGLTILVRSMVLSLRDGQHRRGSQSHGRFEDAHHDPACLPTSGAVHRGADDLRGAGRDSGRSVAQLSGTWAIRRFRPGARCWNQASEPAPSTSVTGGG